MIALLVFVAVAANPVLDAGVTSDTTTVAGDAGTSDAATLPSGKMRVQVLAKGSRTPIVAATIMIDQDAVGESDADGVLDGIAPCGLRRVGVQAAGFASLTLVRDACADPAPLVLRLEALDKIPVYETVVIASPLQPEMTLSGAELTKTAGTLGDPFRTIESLPGVATPAWPMPIYVIRGANPGNTGYFLDDLRLPGLFHLALGPAVIHPYFFDDLSFYPGGYPARYGRYVSGLVTAHTREPATGMVHASADVRLYDAGGLVSAPLPGGNGSVVVAARYSYTGALLSLVSPDLQLSYWDYQVRADRRFGPVRLTVLALGSQDALSSKSYGLPEGEYVMRFHRVSLRAQAPVGSGQVVAQVATGFDYSKAPLINQVTVTGQAWSVMPRLAYRRMTERVDWETGFDGEFQWLSPITSVEQAGTSDLGRKRNARLLAGYASATVRAGSHLLVTPELRLDSYTISGVEKMDLGPRLSARLSLDDVTWLSANAGRFSQPPSLPLQIPGGENFGLALYGLQTSWQAALGVGSKRLRGLEIEATGYVQRYVLTDLRDTTVIASNPLAEDLLIRRDALSYGVELLLRRPASERLHGWLSYTLSRNLRAFGGGVIGPSDWDQRHIVNLVMGYRLGRNTLGGRAHVNTGRPVLIRGSDAETFVRLPTYYQIDLRAERRFIFDRFAVDVYLELVNATLNRQVFELRQSSSGQSSETRYRVILPSLGVHAEF